MKGYWNQPEETARALRDGWLYTGDIARMDADGFFTIVDRRKDLILVSGHNVYPRDVEEVLYGHPDVLEVGVVAVPDSYQGESVCAFVTLRPGAQVTADEIREYCRRGLAPYKVPRRIIFRDSLPKSMVGKILRRQLRELAQALPDEPKAEPAAASAPQSLGPDRPVADYFEKVLPRLFETEIRPALPPDLAGSEFSVQYTIALAAGGDVTYGLRVTDGQRLTVVPGGLPQPNLAITVSEADWRAAATGQVDMGRGPFELLTNRQRLERAQSLHGQLGLELTRQDGSLYHTTMTYNGAEQPTVTLMMTAANYAAMQRGELSGQAAFLSGSLKFRGDLGFLMAVGSLTQA
jgi:long-chain acyl-CoA synthetase